MRNTTSARIDHLAPAFATSNWILLGLFATAPDCWAGPDSKDAKSALKILEKGAETVIEKMVTAVDPQLAVLFAEFELVEFNLKQGNEAFESTRAFQALDVFQVEVARALLQCAIDFATIQKTATVEWVGGGHALIDLPKGFSPCEKGPVRDFPRDVEKVLAKRYAKIEKRLAKLEILFDEEANRHFAWQLEPPPVQLLGVVDHAFLKVSTLVNPSVDLVIVTSDKAFANDVRVHASGRAGDNAEYTVRLDGPSSSTATANLVVDANDRWHKEWNGIAERNLLVAISGDPGSWGVTRAIGAR